MPINIAIDGPAGAGKSTIAKAVSKELGFIYVDTGALYRAIAYYALNHGVTDDNSAAVTALLGEIKPELRFIDSTQHVFVNGDDVSDKIRTEEISMGASSVAAIPEVRHFLFELQQKIAKENNIIMDGRDIGTVVLPNADVKIFLTASPEERAKRRYKELAEKSADCPTYEEVLEDIKQRDYNDSHRKISPLKQADDAVVADTSDYTLEESITMLAELIKERM